MYNIKTINKISPVGLDKLKAKGCNVGENIAAPDGIIVRSADMESIAPLTKLLTRAEFYAFAEKVFDLPEVKGLLMEAVNEHNRSEQKEGC